MRCHLNLSLVVLCSVLWSKDTVRNENYLYTHFVSFILFVFWNSSELVSSEEIMVIKFTREENLGRLQK